MTDTSRIDILVLFRTFVTILFAKLTMTAFFVKVNSVYLVAIGGHTEFFTGMGMKIGYIRV
jgi:hypothetical protein